MILLYNNTNKSALEGPMCNFTSYSTKTSTLLFKRTFYATNDRCNNLVLEMLLKLIGYKGQCWNNRDYVL